MAGPVPAQDPWLPPLGAQRPSWRNLFCFSLAGLGLVWLPMATLEQIDALLAFVTWLELASDIALLLVFLTLVSIGLATAGWMTSTFAKCFGTTAKACGSLAWMTVCVPITVLCIGQFSFAAKQWLLHAANLKLPAGVPYKPLILLALATAVALLWWRLGTVRLILRITNPLLALKIPALAISAAATAHVLAYPPPLARQGEVTTTLQRNLTRGPDIFIFSLDALAAEDAGICDEGLSVMPRLRQFATRASCFTRFYAVSNLTGATTTTMETATLPWTHWVIQGGRVPAHLAENSIGDALRRAGYSRHTFSAVWSASPLGHGTRAGYDTTNLVPPYGLQSKLNQLLYLFPDARSLSHFFTAPSILLSTIDLYWLRDQNSNPPENTYRKAQSLLESLPKDQPAFLWMHTWAPHYPYLPPKSTKYKLLPKENLDDWHSPMAPNISYPSSLQPLVDRQRLRYRESLMDADEKLGEFLDTLDRANRLDNALVIITGDHGESFERGYFGHAGEPLHEAVIRIPLVVKLPGQRTALKIDVPASQVDLAPTILDMAGAPQLPLSEGRSLRTVLAGGTQQPSTVVSMSIGRESRFRPIKGGQYVAIEGNYKLIYHLARQKSELYDLASDPRELRDLTTLEPEISASLRSFIQKRIEQAEAQRQQLLGNNPSPGQAF